MDAFDVLTNKGDELVAQRDKTANEGERALLNKQIKAIRMAQFKLISNEVIEIIKPQIPQIVADAIKAAGLEKRIAGLKTNAEKMEMHKQSGAPTPDEYFSPDAEFMAQVEERLGSCLTEEQRRYFDGVDSSAGIDLNSYFGREIEHFDAAPSMPEPEPEMAAAPEAEQRKRVFNAIGIRY
ncbi:TPA: hypothetical protein OU177_000123 [Escherichia coli]|uniref:hypothetical protein n=1 Tax=Escherichia coli TaxID=562 RepID=UPI0010220B50|nr:hypothetical protein [Escherichia coli]EFV2002475.1 hypothetical protein [Escherichia coli]ELX1844777.1 hypothetical protein [Escherichia coli]EMF1791492.1 hypothetical protein [Escherichia coli]MEC4122360.1 hypothetical protein [Escherichia coli]MEC4156818.1 hypothetical protein [Escherichia coli]